MNQITHQVSELDRQGELRERLRAVGLLLVTCSPSGEIVEPSRRGDDWLIDLFCAAPLFHKALRDAATYWDEQERPVELEVMPGLWLAPAPVMRRRRCVGYGVAVVPTAEFLDAEQLAAMCQVTRQDFEVTRRLLSEMAPSTKKDVSRIAALIRFTHDDQIRLADNCEAMEHIGLQLGESYEEISLLYTIIRSMTVEQNPAKFVAVACDELLGTLPYAWIGAQMIDDPGRLKRLSGQFIMAGEARQPLDDIQPLVRELLDQTETDVPIVLEPAFNPKHAAFAPLGRTVLVHPMSTDGKVIGVLIAGDKQGSDPAASSVDIKLLGATTTHMAIFLENAALYDDLRAMFIGTLEALTASIDAKDRYTSGHSQRVALLTRQLAEAVGMDEQTLNRLHIAGLVHDVGKIGVPEAVLTKPGRLTEEEFEEIKKHPEIGYRILKDIPQLQDILPGVLYHHERWDGHGYPHGLSGEQIPLMARLITLADSFDAMSSTRTYRSRLSRDEVLKEIRDCAGTQFDPELAPIFARLDFSEYDRMVIEHQAADIREISDTGEAA